MLVRIGRRADVAPGTMRAFDLDGRRIAVASVDGTLYAFDDSCTHAGCSLADGELDGTKVTATALHPGFVATGFGHNNGGLMRTGMNVVQKIAAKKPEQGAATSVYLASSPVVEGVTGKYFSDQKETQSSAASYDEGAQQRLWTLSEQMVRARVQA